MKKTVIFSLLLLITPLTYSQSFFNSLNADLRYPIPVGDNFMNSNDLDRGYTGIIGGSIGVDAFRYRNLSFGVQVSTSLLSLSVSDLKATMLSPLITLSYDFRPRNISFIPQAGFGYMNIRFKSAEYDRSDDGTVIEGSLRIVFRRPGRVNYYFAGAYQFIRLEKPKHGEIDSKFNRNIGMFYPDAGVIINLK